MQTLDMATDQTGYPVISIITPSYNQGRYLAGTIESVLRQQGDFYLDYIIVDGGSSDNSVEIMKHYEQQLGSKELQASCRSLRFRWISERDEGQTDAINKGLNMAAGDILAWLNSDDTYVPGALQAACRTFEENPGCSVLYGKSYYIDENDSIVGEYPTEPFSIKRLASFNFIAQPSVFFRKSAIIQAGYPDKNLHYSMDYDLWLRIARKNAFLYHERFLSNYRLHADSKTVSPRHALENARECLVIAQKNYGWAPLNRVFVYAFHKIVALTPRFLSFRLVTIPSAVIVASLMYFRMNRSIKMDDVRMLSFKNMLKALNLFNNAKS